MSVQMTFLCFILFITAIMSDVLKDITNIKFNSRLKVDSEPSKFLHKSFRKQNDVALSLRMSNDFILQLADYSKEFPDLTLLDIVSSQLDFVSIKKSCRLEIRLKNTVSDVKNAYKRLNRSKGPSVRDKWKKRIHTIAVNRDEIENVRHLKKQLEEVKKELITVHRYYINVLNQLIEAKSTQREQATKIADLESQVNKLKTENTELFSYLETKLGAGLPLNRGKLFDDVSKQQQNRKILDLKEYTTNALWFAETYGLVPKSITLKSNAGTKVKVSLDDKLPSGQRKANFLSLPSEDKRKIQELSYILDRFAVSDGVYHELHMLCDDLPQSRLLVQARNDLSKIFEIKRVPGAVPGAYISFQGELLRLYNVTSLDDIPSDHKVAFGGDGTQVSRVSSFVNFSFKIIEGKQQSAQKTVAIIKVPEKFELLQVPCGPLFQEVNQCVGHLNLFLTGDKKFQNMMIGLPVGFGSAIFACNHCKVAKENLMKTDLPWNYYHAPGRVRTLESVEVGKHGQMREPLVLIPYDNIVLCSLHLCLRITDVLESNIIEEVKQMDHRAKVLKKEANHLKNLVAAINEIVHFEVREETKNGRTTMTWTSLTGDAKKKLLRQLPDKLPGLLHRETAATVVKIWRDFDSLLSMLQCPDESENFHLKYFDAANAWLKLFLSLKNKRLGYARVTWYMHDLVYHVPYILQLYGNVDIFSGQSLEKNNDIIKVIHMKKTRKWDATMEALKLKKRLERAEELSLARKIRGYEKKDEKYWNHTIHILRKSQRNAIKDEIAATVTAPATPVSVNIKSFKALSAKEIKQKIFRLGMKTTLKSKEKLLTLYLKLLQNKD